MSADISWTRAAHDALVTSAGHVRTALARVRRRADSEAMHDLRVAGRRARAVLMFYAEAWDGPEPLRLKRAIRRVARKLGPVRDLEATRDLLISSVDGMRGRSLRMEASAARHEIESRLDRRMRAQEHPAERELKSLLRELDRIPDWNPPPECMHGRIGIAAEPRAIRKRLRVFARPVERNRPRRSGSAHEWHQYRIRIKKYRYALELAQAQDIPGLRKRIRRLAAIQDLLGKHHDISVLFSLLKRSAPAVRRGSMPGPLATWFSRRQKQLIRSASDLARQI